MAATLATPPQFEAGSKLANGWTDGKGRFLIDGFPRKMDQALMFDKAVSLAVRRGVDGGPGCVWKWRVNPLRVKQGEAVTVPVSPAGGVAER